MSIHYTLQHNAKSMSMQGYTLHCKDTIPKIQNKYSQIRNYVASVPISTFIWLWAIYIFPRSVCLFCCRKICRSILGIYKSLTDTWMWKLRLRPSKTFSGNTYVNGILVAVYYKSHPQMIQRELLAPILLDCSMFNVHFGSKILFASYLSICQLCHFWSQSC